MTQSKIQLKRLLLLEVCLAVGGILLVSALYLYTIGQQQRITEELFSHPFLVSNAALEFRSDVLSFRRFMLETILNHKKADVARMHLLEEQMDKNITIIRREFLGDKARVNSIIVEMAAWQKIREQIRTAIIADDTDAALRLALQQESPHIEQILKDTDQVISFARSRALRFVEEGRVKLIQSRLMLGLLAVLTLAAYFLLSFRLRRGIYTIYDREAQHATFDYLTGAHNHRSFMKHGDTEIKRARRHEQSLSLLMIDLDHFKEVNDTYGHDAGDSVLRQFSDIFRQNLRGEDLLGRVGGEEFAILLPVTDLGSAMTIAERIRQEVAGSSFKIAGDKLLKVTISIGVVTLEDDMAAISDLLKRADEALYLSKHGGRNRVTAYPSGNADCVVPFQ